MGKVKLTKGSKGFFGTIPSILTFAGLTYFDIWSKMEGWQAVLIGIALILNGAMVMFREKEETVEK